MIVARDRLALIEEDAAGGIGLLVCSSRGLRQPLRERKLRRVFR